MLKRIRAVRAMMREAKRRGVGIDELANLLTPYEILKLNGNYPDVDVTRFGLVPDALVTGEKLDDPLLAHAVAAIHNGEWRPAAELVTSSWGDWETRAKVVTRLAKLAADDETWLKAWHAEEPDNPHANVVHAEALTNVAWQIRGGHWASKTSEAQFEGFHRVLANADTAAWKATELLPEDPTPWANLVTIARGLMVDHDGFRDRWESLVERAPLHRPGHDAALQYWCAKWRGSHEHMLAFARASAEKAPELQSLLLRAAYEWETFHGTAAGYDVWREQWVSDSLNSTLRWLSEDGAQSANHREDLGWTINALVETSRHAEAVPLLQRFGAHVDSGPWVYFAEPVAEFCYVRAKICTAAAR